MDFKEENHICAFIDILGFGDAMRNASQEKKSQLFSLLYKLSGKQTSHGNNTEYPVIGAISRPTCQITTFSDNVVLSFPFKSVESHVPSSEGTMTPVPVSPHSFLHHLFMTISGSIWDAMELGVLFRGGVTYGSLHHSDHVVAGEALIKAVRLEKETQFPRIEVSNVVLDLIDSQDDPLFKRFKDACIIEYEGHHIFHTIGFHHGIWIEYLRKNNIHKMSHQDAYKEAYNLYSKIEKKTQKHLQNSPKSIADKWKWFSTYFKNSLNSGRWAEIKSKM